MIERKMLKPAEGCLVRHPGNYRPLAAEGESVEMTSYWVRKLRDQDVVEIKQDEAEAEAKAETSQKKTAGGK
jgi:hypothetical protein